MSDLLMRISSLDEPCGDVDAVSSDEESADSVGSDAFASSTGDGDAIRSDMATEASFDVSRVTKSALATDTLDGREVGISDQDTLDHTEIMQKYMKDMMSSCQVHFMDVKRRLLDEKDFTVRARDAFYTEHLTRQQQIIEKLNDDLSRSENEKAYESRRLSTHLDRTLKLYGRRLVSHMSEFSTIRIFYRWKEYAAERVRLAQMVRLSNKFLRRSLLARAFSAMSKEYYEKVITKRENESKFRFEGTARVMVERYEGEISRLQGECKEAQAALRQESYRRQQLEEDLRRMFLKNMTVMNMEALSLFQNPSMGPPQMAATANQSPPAIESAQAEYTSSNTAESTQHQEMKYQQQTLQQQRVQVNVASELHRVSRQSDPSTTKPRVTRAVADDDADAYPRASMPPQPVRNMSGKEHKVIRSAAPRR